MTNTGNPDEISIEPETRNQPPTPMNRPVPPRGPPAGPPAGRFDSNVVTPSKPERWNAGNPAGRQPLPPNARPNPSAIPDQRRPMPATGPANNLLNNRPAGPPQPHPAANGNMQNAHGQPHVKRESAGPILDQNQPPASQSVGFYSARAADQLRDNPSAGPLPGTQFDPHAESPSIRKTAGVDHTKSVPISKPMLTGASPASNSSRDYINPATDLQRRVGAPGGIGSPLARGPSTSSYRPLTRPNIDPKNVPNPAAMNRGSSVPPQNLNGKRPPLSDVTNANASPCANNAPPAGLNDPKRPRMADGTAEQQQPPQAPQQ